MENKYIKKEREREREREREVAVREKKKGITSCHIITNFYLIYLILKKILIGLIRGLKEV